MCFNFYCAPLERNKKQAQPPCKINFSAASKAKEKFDKNDI
jgi:hypothetical protein